MQAKPWLPALPTIPDLYNRGHASDAHGLHELVTQQLEDVVSAILTLVREPPQHGSTHEDSAGTEGDRLKGKRVHFVSTEAPQDVGRQ